jgi:hypothetical protein
MTDEEFQPTITVAEFWTLIGTRSWPHGLTPMIGFL